MPKDVNVDNSENERKRAQKDILLATAWELIFEKKYNNAEKTLKEATDLDMNDKFLWAILGKVYTELEEYAKAVKAYQKSVTIDLWFASAWFRLGLVLLQEKKFDEAQAAFDQYNWLTPEYGEKQTRYLVMDAQKKEIDKSNLKPLLDQMFGKTSMSFYDELEKKLRTVPNSAEGWFDRAKMLAENKFYDLAHEAIQETLKLRPNWADAWELNGSILLSLGFVDEAKRALSHSDYIRRGMTE